MQMSIYNRKHWHALSHSLHFVRHEGRLVTISRTRLIRSMRMAGQCSRTQVHQVVLRMTAGPKPTLQLLRFCVSLIVVLYFLVISFSRVFAFLVCGLFNRSFCLSFCLSFGSHFVRPLKRMKYCLSLCVFVWG